MCLITNPQNRPKVSQLLRHPLIQNKIIEQNISIAKSKGDIAQIMNTIKLPKNMNALISKLPKKRYTMMMERPSSHDPARDNQIKKSKFNE